MDEGKQIGSTSPNGSMPPSAREEEAFPPYDSASGEQQSGIDEKRGSERSSSDESASRLLHDARELEEQTQPSAAAPEDLVPRRTKIIFVALYFFLNLSLTLSNKSVLSRVSPPHTYRQTIDVR